MSRPAPPGSRTCAGARRVQGGCVGLARILVTWAVHGSGGTRDARSRFLVSNHQGDPSEKLFVELHHDEWMGNSRSPAGLSRHDSNPRWPQETQKECQTNVEGSACEAGIAEPLSLHSTLCSEFWIKRRKAQVPCRILGPSPAQQTALMP